MLLGLGIVLGIAGIGFLCWLLFLCAVFAAPLFVATMVCTTFYDHAMMSGSHAILAGIGAGIMVLVLGQAMVGRRPTPSGW